VRRGPAPCHPALDTWLRGRARGAPGTRTGWVKGAGCTALWGKPQEAEGGTKTQQKK